MIRCIAFDCFGTIFNMDGISRDEIADYVNHVRRNDFSPYTFPESWWNLKLHPDAAEGISMLQRAGFWCVALSNGSYELLQHVSRSGGIEWNRIIDLAKHEVYKPHIDAYRTVEHDTDFPPHETLMVTANPTFGDIEGASAIGMHSQVIRRDGFIRDTVALALSLIEIRGYIEQSAKVGKTCQRIQSIGPCEPKLQSESSTAEPIDDDGSQHSEPHRPNTPLETSPQILISAMRSLAGDIISNDGVASAAISEAADRLNRYHKALVTIGDGLADDPAKVARDAMRRRAL